MAILGEVGANTNKRQYNAFTLLRLELSEPLSKLAQGAVRPQHGTWNCLFHWKACSQILLDFGGTGKSDLDLLETGPGFRVKTSINNFCLFFVLMSLLAYANSIISTSLSLDKQFLLSCSARGKLKTIYKVLSKF